jgi:hypothetical protein
MSCGDLTLKEAFLVLYGIACACDTSVEAYLEMLGGSIQWNVRFARVAHDWEVMGSLQKRVVRS